MAHKKISKFYRNSEIYKEFLDTNTLDEIKIKNRNRKKIMEN